jgi:hypothetical protein
LKTIAEIPDNRRVTKRDFVVMEKLLDSTWFAIPRKPLTANQKQFVNLVLAAKELHARNKKYPTVGEAREEQQKKIEHREKLNRDYYSSHKVNK